MDPLDREEFRFFAGRYPHQIEGIAFLARKGRAIFGDDMDLGNNPLGYRRDGECSAGRHRTRDLPGQPQRHVGESMASAFASFAEGDALDYSVRVESQDVYEFDVTGCRYAQFYNELGEPGLGFLLVCSADFPFAEGFGPDIQLTRTQSIMQGANHCDFRYRRHKD